MPLVFGRSIFGFAVVSAPPVSGWTDPDLTNASYDSVSFSVTNEEAIPSGLFFKPDGTKMYVIGYSNSVVAEYDLSTSWDVSTAVVNQTTSISAQEGTSMDLFFKPDGTKMYIVGQATDNVYEYDLSTAWDISTKTYNSNSLAVGSQENAPRAMFIKPDGTKMYIVGPQNGTVYQYALSTAWDVSTGSFETGKTFSVTSQETQPQGLFFSPDGTTMFVSGNTTDSVYKYTLSTAWDVSTASYASESVDLSSENTAIDGVFFKPDGSKMYVVGLIGDTVYQYSTAAAPAVTWTNPDLTNASYDSVSLNISSTTGTFVSSIKIEDSDTKIYVCSNSNDRVYQWDLSTASDLSSASLHGSFATGTQTTAPSSVFFKTDGTKMYVADGVAEDIYQYALSTAWDVTTASYESKSFSPSEVTTGTGIFFSTDGTKFYYEDYATETTFQYTLSTAWDISTASYDSKSFTTTTQASDKYDIFFSPNGDKFYKISLPSDTIYQYSLSTAWDISTASYDNISFSVTSQASIPISFSFNSTGSKLYVLDTNADTIFQYSTVAPAWTNPDIAAASYDSVSFSVASQDNNPRAVAFSSDGSKMFMIGVTADNVYQYSLSTSWDPSSATYDSVSFSVGTQETSPNSIIFKSDGTSFYVIGYTNSVYQYDLTTAYDLSTASYASKSLSTGLTNAVGLSISTDGTKLWAADIGGTIQQFTMSTAWDVSTASSDSKSLDVSARGATTTGIYVSHDGSAVYITNLGTDTIYEYDLSTDYDISTGTYNSVSFSVATQETNPWGFTFKNDGSKMYLIGNIGDSVYQYSTVAPAWTNPDIANASYDSVSFSVNTQDTIPRGLSFKADGTKMYMVGQDSDLVHQYSLSTAWDLSTASYDSVSFDVSTEDTFPQEITFNNDGTSFYIIGAITTDILQYDLTTAWDISTASYASKSYDSLEETAPNALSFKSDGTKMYLSGNVNDTIYQYSLSTAWDISTASYDSKSFSYASITSANGKTMFISPNGDKVWIATDSTTGDHKAFEFSLSTAWDISTASYSSINFNFTSQDTSAQGIFFKDDGSKMYMLGLTSDTIYQYST